MNHHTAYQQCAAEQTTIRTTLHHNTKSHHHGATRTSVKLCDDCRIQKNLIQRWCPFLPNQRRSDDSFDQSCMQLGIQYFDISASSCPVFLSSGAVATYASPCRAVSTPIVRSRDRVSHHHRKPRFSWHLTRPFLALFYPDMLSPSLSPLLYITSKPLKTLLSLFLAFSRQ